MEINKLIFAIIISLFSLSFSYAQEKSLPIIVDTDMGTDDAMALIYLFNRTGDNVAAVIVDGNASTHCHSGVKNALKLLELAHLRSVPVACGATNSFLGGHYFPERIRHDLDRLRGMPLPNTDLQPVKQAGVDLMIEVILKSKQKVKILALGSLTNVALALQKQPKIKAKIERIYWMGGAIDVPGNIRAIVPNSLHPEAEWNVYFDPKAAAYVFQAGIPLTLFPLDATNQVPITPAFIQRLKNHKPSRGVNAVKGLFIKNLRTFLKPGWYFWDPLVAVAMIEPNIVQTMQEKLKIVLESGTSYAKVKRDEKGMSVDVVYQVNAKQFIASFLMGLSVNSNKVIKDLESR